MRGYRDLESLEIPFAVLELGIRPGDRGVIEAVYNGGRMLSVEVPSKANDGASVGFVDLVVESDGSLKLVSFSMFSA